MTEETKQLVKITVLAVIASIATFVYIVFIDPSYCETIREAGGEACSVKDRLDHLTSDVATAVFAGVTSIFVGSMSALGTFIRMEHLRQSRGGNDE